MIADDVLRHVQAIVSEVAGPGRTPRDVGPETLLGDGGFGLDSLEVLDVVLALEQRLGIDFDAGTELTAQALRSLRSLAALSRSKLR